MKKVLYAIFSIAIFVACNLSVQADEFNYQSCTNDCKNAGDQYNICMASCDAKKLIEEKKKTCQNYQTCINNLENTFSIKRDYYLDYYTNKPNSSNYFNYSKFDYYNCTRDCTFGGNKADCEDSCQARLETQECILDAKTTTEVEKCKASYNKIYSELVKENHDQSSNYDYTDYYTCKSKCNGFNEKECESDCYAQDKVYECLSACGEFDCSSCKESYHMYYQQRLNSYNSYAKVQCGDLNVPMLIPQIVRTIIVILQVATPVIIIILGSIDLVKAVAAQKEDEIKKGQQTFLRRLLVGVLVFLVFVIVEFIIGLVAPKNENYNMWNCVDCFINGDCQTK